MKKLLRKIKKSMLLIINPSAFINEKSSYYPNEAHKSKVEILLD